VLVVIQVDPGIGSIFTALDDGSSLRCCSGRREGVGERGGVDER
jgi:hypothetical protein